MKSLLIILLKFVAELVMKTAIFAGDSELQQLLHIFRFIIHNQITIISHFLNSNKTINLKLLIHLGCWELQMKKCGQELASWRTGMSILNGNQRWYQTLFIIWMKMAFIFLQKCLSMNHQREFQLNKQWPSAWLYHKLCLLLIYVFYNDFLMNLEHTFI